MKDSQMGSGETLNLKSLFLVKNKNKKVFNIQKINRVDVSIVNKKSK